MTSTLKIRKPDDFHVHFRLGQMLEKVFCFTGSVFARALVMPNTSPPILTAKNVTNYRRDIRMLSLMYNYDFWPLMTIQINALTTPEIIVLAKKAGVVAGKVYPQGVTTNSQNGVADFRAIYPVFEKMQEVGMVLCLHGEDPAKNICCLDREEMFLPLIYQIATDFTHLRIVLEHITTKEAVECVARWPDNVAATITPHHLAITIDDVVGGLLNPHNFCKPIAKRREDRDALIHAAISGNPKFFLGTDSAPHLRENKECASGCAGVFNAPVALPLYAQIFWEKDALDRLEPFASEFGALHYGLPLNEGTIELIQYDWIVPNEYSGIVPFCAGQRLCWQVAK